VDRLSDRSLYSLDTLLCRAVRAKSVVDSGVSDRILPIDSHLGSTLRTGEVANRLVNHRMGHLNSLAITHARWMSAQVSGVDLGHANFCNARGILWLSLTGRVSVVL
jgi:hypothetical protein